MAGAALWVVVAWVHWAAAADVLHDTCFGPVNSAGGSVGIVGDGGRGLFSRCVFVHKVAAHASTQLSACSSVVAGAVPARLEDETVLTFAKAKAWVGTVWVGAKRLDAFFGQPGFRPSEWVWMDSWTTSSGISLDGTLDPALVVGESGGNTGECMIFNGDTKSLAQVGCTAAPWWVLCELRHYAAPPITPTNVHDRRFSPTKDFCQSLLWWTWVGREGKCVFSPANNLDYVSTGFYQDTWLAAQDICVSFAPRGSSFGGLVRVTQGNVDIARDALVANSLSSGSFLVNGARSATAGAEALGEFVQQRGNGTSLGWAPDLAQLSGFTFLDPNTDPNAQSSHLAMWPLERRLEGRLPADTMHYPMCEFVLPNVWQLCKERPGGKVFYGSDDLSLRCVTDTLHGPATPKSPVADFTGCVSEAPEGVEAKDLVIDSADLFAHVSTGLAGVYRLGVKRMRNTGSSGVALEDFEWMNPDGASSGLSMAASGFSLDWVTVDTSVGSPTGDCLQLDTTAAGTPKLAQIHCSTAGDVLCEVIQRGGTPEQRCLLHEFALWLPLGSASFRCVHLPYDPDAAASYEERQAQCGRLAPRNAAEKGMKRLDSREVADHLTAQRMSDDDYFLVAGKKRVTGGTATTVSEFDWAEGEPVTLPDGWTFVSQAGDYLVARPGAKEILPVAAFHPWPVCHYTLIPTPRRAGEQLKLKLRSGRVSPPSVLPLRELTTSRVESCLAKCAWEPLCRSMDFAAGSGACRLLAEEPTELDQNPDFAHYQR